MKGPFVERGPRGYYKPFATRSPVLISLLLFTLTLIALTEYACRRLPNHAGIGALGNAVNGTLKRDLNIKIKRNPGQQVERFESFNPILTVPLSLLSTTSSSSSSSSISATQTATGGYLSLGDGSGSSSGFPIPGKGGSITTSIVSGGWLSTGDGGTTDLPSQPTTISNPVSNAISQPTTPSVVGGDGTSDNPSSFVGAAPTSVPNTPVQQPTITASLDGGLTGTNSLLAITLAVFISTTLVESLAGPATDLNASPTPALFVSDGETFIKTSGLDYTADASPVVVTSNGQVFTEVPDPSAAPVVVVSNGQTFTEIPNTISKPMFVVSNSMTFTETPTPEVFVGDGTTFTSQLSPTSGNSIVTPFVVVSDGKTFTSTPSSTYQATSAAIKPVATIVNSTGTFLVWPSGASSIYPQITLQQYVLVSFIPLLIAVVYTIPFRILDRTIREYEPFYQLSQEGGALAEHSLCLEYATSNPLITPFKAAMRGHGYMFWSSLMSLAIVVIAPLSSETLFVSLSGVQGVYGADITFHKQQYASWGIYPTLARLIEGILSFVAVLIVFMIWFGLKRDSGVYGEPLSIAGLATLFHSSPLLRGFGEIDSRASNSELKKVLKGLRYKTGEFTTADYRACYGLLPATSELGFIISAHASRKGPYHLVKSAESCDQLRCSITSSGRQRKEKSKIWEIMKEKLLYFVIFILIAGMLTLIAYYHWSEGDIRYGFEHFMDSGGFGVRFMMTALGVMLKMFWSSLDQDLRRQAPYDRLALSANPIDSILVPAYMSPFSAIIPSLRKKHFLIAHIAFLSILSEFLPICLANIAFSATTTQAAYETCNDISMTILALMLISIVFLLFRPRHNVMRLPRSPDTLASVLMYLAAEGGCREREGLLDSVKGMERMETEERNETIESWARMYSLGLDRKSELRVDEDERIHRLWID